MNFSIGLSTYRRKHVAEEQGSSKGEMAVVLIDVAIDGDWTEFCLAEARNCLYCLCCLSASRRQTDARPILSSRLVLNARGLMKREDRVVIRNPRFVRPQWAGETVCQWATKSNWSRSLYWKRLASVSVIRNGGTGRLLCCASSVKFWSGQWKKVRLLVICYSTPLFYT